MITLDVMLCKHTQDTDELFAFIDIDEYTFLYYFIFMFSYILLELTVAMK